MLMQEDWEIIASAAADSLKQQIMPQVLVERRRSQGRKIASSYGVKTPILTSLHGFTLEI